MLAASGHVDRRTAASAIVNGDDGSPADEGYIEFLRFLQSPTLEIHRNEDCRTNWEAELRETSGNDTEIDLTTTLQEEETDDDSMYVGPGEIGFYYSESIHESDISETDSEYKELDEDVNNLIDTRKRTVSVIGNEQPQTSSEYDNEDTRSTSASDGYNEFLRFLAAPTLPLSVKNAETVLVDHEESGSVDDHCKEFLFSLPSPRRVEHVEPEDANVCAISPNQVNHLEESKVEEVSVRSHSLEEPEEPKAEEVYAKSSRQGKLVGDTEIEEVYSRSSSPEKVMREVDMKEGYSDSPIPTINLVHDYDVSKQEPIKSKPAEEPREETKVDEGYLLSPISNRHIFDIDESSPSLVKPLGESAFNEGSLQPIGPIAFGGNRGISTKSMRSHSPTGFLDDFYSSLSEEESSQSHSLIKPLDGTESANASEQPASPIIALEDFSDYIHEESESQFSLLSKCQSTAFILWTMLLSIVFHICQFRIEAGIAEVVTWLQLMAPYALNLSK